MAKTQGDNFIKVLQASYGEQHPLANPDWDEMAELAKIHTVTALFFVGASRYDSFSQWEGREKLQRKTIASVGAQAMRTQQFLQLYGMLLEEGLHPLVLKGIICRQLYGPLADYRPSCDEDLYLPPEELERCCQVLKQQGWQLASEEASLEVADRLQEIAFEHPGHQLRLELHPTLFGTDDQKHQRRTQYFEGIMQRAVQIEVEGTDLYTLGYTDHYVYLFLHLAKHFASSGVGIRQILDLMLFARAYEEQIDWPEVLQAVQTFSSPGLYADVATIGTKLGFLLTCPFQTVQPEKLLEDSLAGGVYGHDREGKGRGTVLSNAMQYPTVLGRVQRLLFPTVTQLQEGRPWLLKRPWLLPVAWGQRALLLFRDGKRSRVTGKSLLVAYKRVELFRAYGMTTQEETV